MIELGTFQMIRHRIQLMIFQPGKKIPGNRHRINRRKRTGKLGTLCRRLNKPHIKRSIMCNQRFAFPAKIIKLPQRFRLVGRIRHHFIGNTG